MKFGDRYVNPWASDRNPTKVGYFVRWKYRSRGRTNPGKYMELTDKKGKFWELEHDNHERYAEEFGEQALAKELTFSNET